MEGYRIRGTLFSGSFPLCLSPTPHLRACADYGRSRLRLRQARHACMRACVVRFEPWNGIAYAVPFFLTLFLCALHKRSISAAGGLWVRSLATSVVNMRTLALGSCFIGALLYQCLFYASPSCTHQLPISPIVRLMGECVRFSRLNSQLFAESPEI